MNCIEELKVGRLKVEIHKDDYDGRAITDVLSCNERGGAVIICSFYHTRSALSEVNPFETFSKMQNYAADNGYNTYNLWRYEHSAVSFAAFPEGSERSYPYNCQWDSGMEGYVLVDPKQVGDDPLQAANSCLSELSDWYNGEIYGFRVFDEEGDEVDSCWGIIGYEWAKEYAKDSAVSVGDILQKQRGEQLCLKI